MQVPFRTSGSSARAWTLELCRYPEVCGITGLAVDYFGQVDCITPHKLQVGVSSVQAFPGTFHKYVIKLRYGKFGNGLDLLDSLSHSWTDFVMWWNMYCSGGRGLLSSRGAVPMVGPATMIRGVLQVNVTSVSEEQSLQADCCLVRRCFFVINLQLLWMIYGLTDFNMKYWQLNSVLTSTWIGNLFVSVWYSYHCRLYAAAVAIIDR